MGVDKDSLTRIAHDLRIEDELAKQLRARIQDLEAREKELKNQLGDERTRVNMLNGDLAQLKLEYEAKDVELAEAQQMGQSDGATGTVNSDRFASYSKSVHSQLAAAQREEEARQEQRVQQRPQSPGDENLTQDTDTDQSFEEITTTVIKKVSSQYVTNAVF